MTKTVEIHIPNENRIIVCTEGSLENKLYELGKEQGKLDLVELIRKEMDKMGDDEPGGIMCHRRECFEPGICFHEIERLARLKSQIKKQGAK
jgi:hypothetical protein